ncbi:MAG: GDSL-type esterase/lipase family protein [Opitutales bacterium]|nr:GDSL-type esterase/lipase family protein [Opitutales bacterium]
MSIKKDTYLPNFPRLLSLAFAFLLLVSFSIANPVIYKAGSPSQNKKLVFVASDHEYRAEETLPALARILSVHHGFDCTVLFGQNTKGEIEAGASNIPGLEALKEADGMIMFTRFLALPPAQMKHIDDYLNRAGPVVGLRTSTHGFKYDKALQNDPYAKFDFRFAGKDYKGGFGEQILGQSWVGHYGQNHRQSTRIDLVPEKKNHPILRGVSKVHVKAGGYNAEAQPDWNILTMAQPLMSMEPTGKNDPQKPPMASEWTRTYTAKNGKKGRVFTSLYGASMDLVNPGYRRLILNGIYWTVGLENKIKPDSKIEFVGAYTPSKFENRGEVKGLKPSMYKDLKSPIPADPNSVVKKVKSVTARNQNIRKGARFLRIEIPKDNKVLTLNEVEIISGGKNIASLGKTSQSSTGAGGVASRAVDGNKDPDYNKGGQTHTDGFGTVNPWWEIDLGKEYKIDEVEVWNRKGFESRLDGFTIQLLDANRKQIYKSGKTKGAQRIKFTLRFRTILEFFLYNGKPEPTAFKPLPYKVNVPADYKDVLPFAFKKGDRIAILGNGLADRMQHDGWTETLLQSELTGQEVTFRNMSLSGDRPNSYPRSSGFMSMNDYLRHVKADAVFAMFGYNESFEGEKGTKRYRADLITFVKNIRGSMANRESFPRIVLFSPIAFQDLKDRNLPRGKLQNRNLEIYTKVTEEVAAQEGVEFVDLFHPTRTIFQMTSEPLTINGAHLNEEGNRKLAEVIAKALLLKEVKAKSSLEALRQAVIDKNWHWLNRYRATDGNDIWGSRSKLRFVDDQSNAKVLQHELVMIDSMTANRDQHIWKIADGETSKVDDSNVPAPIKVDSNVGGGSISSSAIKEGSTKYLSPAESLNRLAVGDGFEVNIFADEKQFPELINPVQMQVDTKGRLWAAVWPTYPMWEPLKPMSDALVILPDDNNDGKADRVIEFAKVHNPLGFEFWNGGVLVTSGPDLLFLKDTDGDDRADVRYVMLQGLGTSDTHHSANNLIYGPDGGIYWQSGVFLQHNHEHPWGPSLKTTASAMYRFDPRRHTIAFHGSNSPNPHGIAFDYWGYHYATDGTGGRAYQVFPDGKSWKMRTLLAKEVRPVPACEILSSDNFPDDLQGDFLICNTIGFLGVKQYKLHRDGGFTKTIKSGKWENGKNVSSQSKLGEVWGTPNGQKLSVIKDLAEGSQVEEESIGFMLSGDKNFRPTDAIFGQDGGLYVSDWQNVIIGHMQHNVRDPNRDDNHGRIFRVIHKKKPLQKPVKIDGEPIEKLLINLMHPVDGVRHRTRVELSERESSKVIKATQSWMKQFDPRKKEDAHHLLEALWVHQQHNYRNARLLNQVLKSPEPHARMAALTVQHHWYNANPAKGAEEIEEEHIEVAKKSGVISDTPQLTTVRIGTMPEKMKYDLAEFTVQAGKAVKVIFTNPDFMPHNLVLVNPGKADEVGQAAINLGAAGFDVAFVPKSKDILWASKLIDHKQEEEIQFKAPTKPGNYQYVCTFPGHHFVMRGVMKVK